MIYVTGHQKPDLDSICAAHAMAKFLNHKGEEASPIRASKKVGSAVSWLFDKLDTPLPKYFDNVSGKKLCLVDHTELAQSPHGISSAEVIGVIDHHPQAEDTNYPNTVIDMVGSTCTLIAENFLAENFNIDPKLATIMLAAILDDTVIFRSPTATDRDRNIADKLSQIASIEDLEQFGIDIFTAKSDWNSMTVEQMIDSDAKEWDLSNNLIYCAAMETVDSPSLVARIPDILEVIREKKEREGHHLVLAVIVDILQEKSWIIVDHNDRDPIEDILNGTVSEEGIMEIDGVVSRKKQILKPLAEYFTNRK